MLTEHTGDILALTTRPLMIAHIVNDEGLFGAGFAAQLRHKYIWAYESYQRNHMQRGEVVIAQADGLYIAHLCAMRGVRSRHNPHPLDMVALQKCLHDVCVAAFLHGFSFVAMPKIGAGLAGGHWPDIARLIDNVFDFHGLEARVYDL